MLNKFLLTGFLLVSSLGLISSANAGFEEDNFTLPVEELLKVRKKLQEVGGDGIISIEGKKFRGVDNRQRDSDELQPIFRTFVLQAVNWRGSYRFFFTSNTPKHWIYDEETEKWNYSSDKSAKHWGYDKEVGEWTYSKDKSVFTKSWNGESPYLEVEYPFFDLTLIPIQEN